MHQVDKSTGILAIVGSLVGLVALVAGIALTAHDQALAAPAMADGNANGIEDGTIDLSDINYVLAEPVGRSDFPLAANTAFFSNEGVTFEGPTANEREGTLKTFDLTDDRFWYFPDRSGQVMLAGVNIISPFMLSTSPSPADNDCLTFASWSSLKWKPCIDQAELKAALLNTIADDPAFKADLAAALAP